MKYILMLLLPLGLKAQEASIQIGSTYKGEFSIGTEIGYEWNNVLIGAKGIVVMPQEGSAYFGPQAGYSFYFKDLYILPKVGYFDKYFDRYHQEWIIGYTLEFGKKIDENTFVYLQYDYLNHHQLYIGVKARL